MDHDLAAVWEFNGTTEQANWRRCGRWPSETVRGVGETQQAIPALFSDVDASEVVDVSEILFRTAQVLVYGTRPIVATRGLTETLMDALEDAGEALLALVEIPWPWAATTDENRVGASRTTRTVRVGVAASEVGQLRTVIVDAEVRARASSARTASGYTLAGNLTIKGVSQPVTLETTYNGSECSQWIQSTGFR